ncbi:MAG: response regulator [Bacteroidales bacterium]|nr:response regulator [Bacteroidales bacterium]
MKNNSVQIKIGLLMIIAVILISATGYLSYRNISSIVSSIHIDVNPEQRLLSIREISRDLEKAERSIRLYTITNNTLDLQPYYTIIANIDEKVGRFRSECVNDQMLKEQADTISKLIEENIVIWNQLLYLNNNDKVVESLKQLSDSIDSAAVNARKTEKNILKRVFSRSSKSRFDEKEIVSNLQKIEEQDRITKEKLKVRESKLAGTSSAIREQFYDLMNKIENEVSEIIKTKASAANRQAEKTYRWLAMFSLTGTLLAILVMFILVRYGRKTYAYQIAMEKSKDETEKLAKTKELFMANISHEIRTPVTAISGFTEQLLHEPLDENTTRTLKIIKSSSDHLTRIINDILDFSKLQTNNPVLEKVHFNIRQIPEEVYALFEKQAQQNNNSLSFSTSPDTPPVLLGDPYRLKQIFINLVGNSVKFTKNGEIYFTISCNKKVSEKIELVIEVVDTGIGIDESKLNFIFEDFTQEEMSTTRKYGGTGLGLSIVKKLVELHHGTIDCKSRKNHGTVITCRLPYLIGDEKQIKGDFETPLVIPEEVKKLKVLIVDDAEYNRLLFKTIFDRWNVKYREAVNGIEAMEMVKSDHFNLLFMDARMPGIDGLKATQFIREELNIKESEMPVICISAASLNDDWEKYRKAGMNSFLQKPFTEEILLNTILSVIRGVSKISINDAGSGDNKKPEGSYKIDLNNLYHISGGDEQFANDMLVVFIDTTKKGLNEMDEAVKSGQWKQAADLAHKLLPPCRHIGASDLFNVLKKIDESVRSKADSGVIEKLTSESLREFQIVSDLIKERIAKNS